MSRKNWSPLDLFGHHYQERSFVFYDVGVRHGFLKLFERYLGDPRLQFHGFDGELEEIDRLKASYGARDNVHLHARVISDGEREMTFYLDRDGGGNSLEDRTHEGQVVGRKTLMTTTIDSLAQTLPKPSFLKSDIEHHDYYLFRGSPKTLAESVVGVEFEFNSFHGLPYTTIFDIDPMLKEAGFLLRSLSQKGGYHPRYTPACDAKTNARNGFLYGGDALYLKDIDWILRTAADGKDAIAKAYDLMVVSLIYGADDYVFAIASALEGAGLMDAAVKERILRYLEGRVLLRSKVPNFPWRHRIAMFFYSLYHLFSFPSLIKTKPSSNRLEELEYFVFSKRS